MRNGYPGQDLGQICWTYTRQEWGRFLLASRGRWARLLGRWTHPRVPVIRITPEQISIGDRSHHFISAEKELSNIVFQEQGTVNLMQFEFTHFDKLDAVKEIVHVPVPKGRLGEAVALQTEILRKRS